MRLLLKFVDQGLHILRLGCLRMYDSLSSCICVRLFLLQLCTVVEGPVHHCGCVVRSLYAVVRTVALSPRSSPDVSASTWATLSSTMIAASGVAALVVTDGARCTPCPRSGIGVTCAAPECAVLPVLEHRMWFIILRGLSLKITVQPLTQQASCSDDHSTEELVIAIDQTQRRSLQQ